MSAKIARACHADSGLGRGLLPSCIGEDLTLSADSNLFLPDSQMLPLAHHRDVSDFSLANTRSRPNAERPSALKQASVASEMSVVLAGFLLWGSSAHRVEWSCIDLILVPLVESDNVSARACRHPRSHSLVLSRLIFSQDTKKDRRLWRAGV